MRCQGRAMIVLYIMFYRCTQMATSTVFYHDMRLQTDRMRISNHIRYVRARDEKGKGRRWRARGDLGVMWGDVGKLDTHTQTD